jgi:hypothetical protein
LIAITAARPIAQAPWPEIASAPRLALRSQTAKDERAANWSRNLRMRFACFI